VEALIQNLVLRIGHGRNALLEKRSIQKMEMVFGCCYVVSCDLFTLSGLSMSTKFLFCFLNTLIPFCTLLIRYLVVPF